MRVEFHHKFQKHYLKRVLPYPDLVQRYKERLDLFIKNPEHPSLRDHKLVGKLDSYRSFSLTGDMRILYEYDKKKKLLLLYDVGTHAQVY